MTETNTVQEWQDWNTRREASAKTPYGALDLTATVWLTEETEVPGVPGLWAPEPGMTGRATLKASAADGLALDGMPVDGTVTLRPDVVSDPSVVTFGQTRLVPIRREGVLGVRVLDPASPARQAFEGIDRYPYDEAFVVPAVYTPYPATRTERVLNADGQRRALELTGDVRFELGGLPWTLAVGAVGDHLGATFGDTTNGEEAFAFRRLTLPAPELDGATVIDFNRAYLPPFAFSDQFICPLPPEGNRLPVAVGQGSGRSGV